MVALTCVVHFKLGHLFCKSFLGQKTFVENDKQKIYLQARNRNREKERREGTADRKPNSTKTCTSKCNP